MATRQNLKGVHGKNYEIINTFNKGYNTSVADDLLSENVFRSLSNFLPSEEGNITKRPGITRTRLKDFFEYIVGENYDMEKFKVTVSGSTNDTSVSDENKKKAGYLYNNLFRLDTFKKTIVDNNVATFVPRTLSNFTIIEDDNILDYMGKFEKLFDTSSDDYKVPFRNNGNLSFIVIFSGDYSETTTGLVTKALRIIKVNIQLSYDDSTEVGTIKISYEIRQPLRGSNSARLTFRYKNDDIIDLAMYANNYYFMNGYDALIKLTKSVSDSTSMQNESIVEYYSDSSLLYKPTAIEISNIGFNIMSKNPLTYTDTQGTANTIRGTFFTYNGEPTQIVPFNKEFEVHLLASGSSTNEVPQYRDNNGEVDTDKNPYKDLPGSYNSDKTVFTCTGLNESGSFELKIKKGIDEYITYFTMGSVADRAIGKVSDVSKLIFSSKYCKVINNQLVIYGGHGYLFYSDYDKFNYFPNYYYVYAAETENEQVVSINYFRQYYAVFTNKRVKRLTGAFGSSDFGLYPLNDSVGCSNPKTIKQAQNYIYFLSYDGLYILKQGYLGEGTENVEQIDLPIYKSYDSTSMLKANVIQNFYALYSKEEAVLYNYVNDAFYRFKNADSKYSAYGTDYEIAYSVPFQYNKIQNDLFYGIAITENSEFGISKSFDICYQNYSEDAIERTDNGLTFISSIETPFMSFGTPTNTKKFKEIYLKFYNKNGLNVPLYVTIMVDDKIVVSPTNYVIEYDEANHMYSYIQKMESNTHIQGYNVIGRLELGEDVLGSKSLQILKLNVNEKGRAIKIIISDGLEQPKDILPVNQNTSRFDLSTIGVVYKLKKVKEG